MEKFTCVFIHPVQAQVNSYLQCAPHCQLFQCSSILLGGQAENPLAWFTQGGSAAEDSAFCGELLTAVGGR